MAGPLRADRLAEARTETRSALRVASADGRIVHRYGDATELILPRSPVEARAVVDRVLGPLIEYDATHGSEYVETVRAMVECDRSWQAAAARLHVHRQTLAYRLRKIEQLTGRGTARTEDLAEWRFATRAQLLLGHTSAAGAGGAAHSLAGRAGDPAGPTLRGR